MAKVLQTSDADSADYTTILLDGPVGGKQAGEVVEVEFGDNEKFEITLHGQQQFDVPASYTNIKFPDGSTHKAKS